MTEKRWLIRLFEAAVLLALVGLAIWLRWPALFTEGFHNEDAAGITYNADLLRHGLLPLVDSHELKAPGSFFMTSWIWAVYERSIAALQQFMAGWAVLGMLGIYAGGRILYGRRGAFLAALLFTIGAPITDSIDINYGAWMITPYIWATVFFMLARRRGALRWLVICGATLAISGLLKRQAALLFPIFVALIIFAPRLPRSDEDGAEIPPLKGLLAFGGGLALGFAPLTIWYATQGELAAFVQHYFFSKGGWRYAKGQLTWAERLPRLGDGFRGFWEFVALPTALTGISLLGALRGRLSWRGILLGGHLLVSFAGASVGFRFFKGYYLQVLPALVWIAAHPAGLLGWTYPTRWRRRRPLSAGLLVAALAIAGLGLRGDLKQLDRIRKMRRRSLDQDAQYVSRVLGPNSTAEDRIWVWGRWAWPVYFHTDRRAPTRYYKVLGVITSNLTNTWRRPTTPTTFEPQGPWRELIADLEKNPPAYIVVAANENYSKFNAFKKLLRTKYKVVPHMPMSKKRMRLYRRRDHKMSNPPKARRRPKRRKSKRRAPKRHK